MKVVAIIPARYGSTRLPGKPLRLINGKPMIWWVFSRVREIEELDEVYVATDDERIYEYCEKNKFPVIMTSAEHKTAASRLQEVSEIVKADFYLQLNGDEPLIDKKAIVAAIPDFVPQDREYGTNIITKISNPVLCNDASNIKVVFDNNLRALYMSRNPIPYPFKAIDYEYYKHVGIIGYNKKMLDFYKNSIPGRFERIEGIDTLRFIDYGKELQFFVVDDCVTLSVDTEKDLYEVEQMMRGLRCEK